MTRTRLPRVAAVVLSGTALALGLAACSLTQPSSSSPAKSTSTSGAPVSSSGGLGGLQKTYVNVVNQVRPSVVEITTDSGLGSGIVFDAKGDIVTNDHVVKGASQFQVSLFDGKSYKGSLVGTYPPDDLAVIRISGASNLQPATFADSKSLQVGDITVAIGNPLGLASSVTSGIVSATGRTVSEPGGVTLPNTIQTSAAINPGNSGGALVDLNAAVIGIPTLAAVDQQLGGGAAPGIGFAIPSNTVKLIAPQLVSSGKVTNSHRAALGIRASPGYSASGRPVGVIIASVTSGGGAAKAGLKAGEIITAVNGTKTPTIGDLESILANLNPGDTVTVTVTGTNGGQRQVKVTLGQLSGS